MDSLADKLTISQAAAELGMNARTVRKICERLGLGQLVTSRLRLVDRADLPKIAADLREPGNPNFGPGFQRTTPRTTASKRGRTSNPPAAAKRATGRPRPPQTGATPSGTPGNRRARQKAQKKRKA